MQTRNIGSLEVSVIGLGCNNFGWRIDANASAKVVDAAIASGINLFDTADRYGNGASEEFLGRALEGRRDQSLSQRSSAWRWERTNRAHHQNMFAERLKRACSDCGRTESIFISSINPIRGPLLRTRSAPSTNWSAAEKCARSAAQTLASSKFAKQQERQRALDLSASRMNSAYSIANRRKACCKNVKKREWLSF